jgi:hypothetical protein
MPLLRYLFLQLAPAAFVANVLINALLGHILYPATVPTWGPGSFANDSFAAAFIIGSTTWFTVGPGARREALSGRLTGSGWTWLAWTDRHPILFAILLGLAAVPSLAVPAVWLVSASSLDHGRFVLLKGLIDGYMGAAAAVFVAALAIASQPRVVWSRPPAPSGPVYPFEYFDKGALAVTDNARGCSGTPTWQLVVDGAIDPAHVRTALLDVITRYPSLATKVEAIDGVPGWATRYHYVPMSLAMDDVFQLVDLRENAGGLAAVTRMTLNAPLNRFTEPPLTLTMVLLPDETRLFFRQHHGIADGRAFIGLLGDFGRYLERARTQTRPTAEELAPIGRRSEAEALQLSTGQRVKETLLGVAGLISAEVKDRRHPRVVLTQNRSNDYSGDNGTVHWLVPDATLEVWNQARKREGVSLNSFLTGALCIAAKRWEARPLGRARVNLMVETRPREGGFVSFANHLARMSVDVQLDQLGDLSAAMHAVQREAKAQRDSRAPIRRLLAETALTYAMPMGDMQRIVFESTRPAINLDFSNLIPLAFPTIGGAGWQVREVLITTPVTPRVGLTLTVIRYNGSVCFNFNYKSTAATREQTEALAKEFAAVLAEAAPLLA